MLADLRYAVRQLRRSPGFAMAAILTIALGIGASTAIFSVTDALVFRALPYPEANRLVMVWEQLLKIRVSQLALNANTLDVYSSSDRIFEAAGAFTEQDRNLITTGGAERISAIAAMPAILEMLGARTGIGRTFTGSETDVAILSHALFMRRFGGNRAIIGQTIRLDDRAYTVVGVMLPRFDFSARSGGGDVWTPLPPATDRGRSYFRMLARLRPDISLQTAQASLSSMAKHVEETTHPYRGPNGEDPGYAVKVITLHDQLLGDFRAGTLILLGAVTLVLLIACVNVGNLLLARAVSREREIAVRRALGATEQRLLRQWMTEGLLLALLGGMCGVWLGLACVRMLIASSPFGLPAAVRISMDFRALLFSLGISAMAGVLFSLTPALGTSRANWNMRGSEPRRRASNWLVAAEVALALTLVVGAGLLLQSFLRLMQVNPGFRPDHLVTMQVQPPHAHRPTFFADVEQRIAALPGVASAGMVSRLPVFHAGANGRGGNPFSIEGSRWNPNSATPQIAHTQSASSDYFRTLGIPLLKGRVFTGADTATAPRVAVVNETLERGFFTHGALGRRILLGAPTPGAQWMTIVGVVGDVKTAAIADPTLPQFYSPMAQDHPSGMALVIRSNVDAQVIARDVTQLIHATDPDAPVYAIKTMEERVNDAVGQPRFESLVVSFFAVAALFLAAIGIYGVVRHSTVQRTREIGIRMALGADSKRVLAGVLTDGMRPVMAGIVVGLAAAIVLARLLETVLFEVKPGDPVTFVAAALSMMLVAIIACLEPARRATRVDPQTALRVE